MNRAALEAALAGLRSRGAIKAFGAQVDEDERLRALLVELIEQRGEAVDPLDGGKRLVRQALDRADEAQVLGTPIRRDGGFLCQHCGAEVAAGGAMVRDHCPRCLRSLHVDRVPGDRANDCQGLLDPVALDLEGRSGVVIRYRCRRCGAAWRGRAHPDDEIPPTLSPADLPGPAAPTATDGPSERARGLPMRVLELIRRQALWAPGARVLVAVSGGLDSTVLIEVLARTAGAHGGRLSVMSFDHGLRPESVQEVAVVGRVARDLGLPFIGRSLGITPGPNLQARARDARREALLAQGADHICTAHHEDDQAETVLLHLLRGSGAAGLKGIALADPPWCRPLLQEPKAVLRAWAEREGLRWTDDPSNPSSQRGELRRLLPALDNIHGGAQGALARSARLIARDDALLEALTEARCAQALDASGLDVALTRAEHPALQLRMLRRLVRASGCAEIVRADQLEAALPFEAREGSGLPLPGGWSLRVVGGRFTLQGPAEPAACAP